MVSNAVASRPAILASERAKLWLIRGPVVATLLFVALSWAFITAFAVMVAKSGGWCDDYGQSCSTADPARAYAILVVGSLGTLAVLWTAGAAAARGLCSRVFIRSGLVAAALAPAWVGIPQLF